MIDDPVHLTLPSRRHAEEAADLLSGVLVDWEDRIRHRHGTLGDLGEVEDRLRQTIALLSAAVEVEAHGHPGDQ
jgi:hypothetical protein